jgi:phosphatidylserine decarboxylase
MAHDAYRFVIPLLLLAILFGLLSLTYLALAAVILLAFVCFFFRNPKRVIPNGSNLVVSPADGKVVKIQIAENGDRVISIFLSIFNVHMNRSPISGVLEHLEYKRGKFKAAYDEAASHLNEQNILTIKGQDTRIVVRQIAGLIARRVVCWKKPGENLKRGELLGLIRFGSRVDVLVPESVKIAVEVGDHVYGGSSVLGECS